MPTATTPKGSGFLSKLLSFTHDPLFIQFEQLQDAPSIFNAVGRTHTETWHSALLGWLLDPSSSHNLRYFPLTRLILLLQTKDNIKVQQRGLDFSELLINGDFSDTVVFPNERKLDEVFVPHVGRFDVFIDGINLESEPWEKIQILIEMKMKARIDTAQNNRYINYANRKRSKRTLIIPVYVAPQNRFSSNNDSVDLLGNSLWLTVDYQDITTYIIEPCLKHPDISAFGKYTLLEYLKTLKYLQHQGAVMAITEEERKMATDLFAKHADAIRGLYEILSETNEEFEHLNTLAGNKDPIKIMIGSTNFEAYSVRELYQNVLAFLVDKNYIDDLQLPFASGPKRYLLSTETVHQTGKDFVAPVEYSDGEITYFMEANKSRDGALSDLSKLLQACGLSLKSIP